jgi:hypothetical protein
VAAGQLRRGAGHGRPQGSVGLCWLAAAVRRCCGYRLLALVGAWLGVVWGDGQGGWPGGPTPLVVDVGEAGLRLLPVVDGSGCLSKFGYGYFPMVGGDKGVPGVVGPGGDRVP